MGEIVFSCNQLWQKDTCGFLVFSRHNQCKLFHYMYKLQSNLSRLRSYCCSKSLSFVRSRPGFQHVMLLLSVKAVQLVQVLSQLEHPCCLGKTPLLTIDHKVTIPIVLTLNRCTMIFKEGCIFNIRSEYAFCTYIKSDHNYAWRYLLGFKKVENIIILDRHYKIELYYLYFIC